MDAGSGYVSGGYASDDSSERIKSERVAVKSRFFSFWCTDSTLLAVFASSA